MFCIGWYFCWEGNLAGLYLVAQSCPTLWDPRTVACQVPLSMRILQARVLERVALLSSRRYSQPRNQTQASRLQVDSFLSESPEKPKNTGVSSLSLLQGNFQANSRNRGFLHCRQILYQLSYLGSPGKPWEVTWEVLSLWLIMKRSQHMAIWEKDLFCKRNSQQRCSYQKGDEKLLTYSGNSILSS